MLEIEEHNTKYYENVIAQHKQPSDIKRRMVKMKRENKFRALACTSGTFVHGYLFKTFKDGVVNQETTWILNDDGKYQVNPETVGQFIGLFDCNVDEIYETDVLKDEYGRILLVEWWKCGFGFKALCETNFIRANSIMEWFEGDTPKPMIIGNIIQNPELRSFTPTP